MRKYRGIALEGGGVAGLAHAGVIKYLEENDITKSLTHFAGSSAGSIAAGLMAIRLSAEEMQDILTGLNFKSFEDNSWFIIRDIYRLLHKFGWNKGDTVETWLSELFKKYTGNPNITFRQVLDEYQSFLIITSTDIGYQQTIYYTPETAPDMPIYKAIRESVSFPYFFCPVWKNNNLYIDGGTLDNYPLHKLYEYLPKEETFGVKIMSSSQIQRRKELSKVVPQDLIQFTSILINMLRDQALRIYIRKDDWVRTIPVDVGDISAMDFDLNDEDKDFLLKEGYNSAQRFFSARK